MDQGREREATTRLRSVVEGRLLVGPETLQVNLGNRCNLDCIFCWNHSPLRPAQREPWKAGRLDGVHLERVVGSLGRLRPGRVKISGRGEPLLHPGAPRLLARLAELSIPVSIQTNGVGGVLSPEALAELPGLTLLVNVSAATADGYERTHPGRGHLRERVVSRLERLAELRRGPGAPAVHLVAVIQRSNGGELRPLVELAARVGAEAVELKGMELVAGLEELMLDRDERAAALEELDAARERARALGLRLEATHLRRLLERQREDGAFSADLRRGPCYMGWYYLRVTTDGDVMFCCKDKRMGTLEERSLYEIWRSPAYHLHRLAGRDGDPSTGLFDAKCRACSNFARNVEIGRQLAPVAIASADR